MKLQARDGANFLELEVYDYQFPDAEDPQLRYSWHRVRGRARYDHEEWEFAFPALTCDETPRVSAWLRAAADSAEADPRHTSPTPAPLRFTEPNFAFTVTSAANGLAHLQVTLSQEFRNAPWATPPYAETVLAFALSPQDLRAAAGDWDTASAPFPDGLA